MIRAVVHLLSDQPIVAELAEMPTSLDVALICRNIRTVDGKRPVFIDRSDSTFVFPYSAIRFIEIHSAAADGGEPGEAAEAAEPEDLEIDEEFLRRVREA